MFVDDDDNYVWGEKKRERIKRKLERGSCMLQT